MAHIHARLVGGMVGSIWTLTLRFHSARRCVFADVQFYFYLVQLTPRGFCFSRKIILKTGHFEPLFSRCLPD